MDYYLYKIDHSELIINFMMHQNIVFVENHQYSKEKNMNNDDNFQYTDRRKIWQH